MQLAIVNNALWSNKSGVPLDTAIKHWTRRYRKPLYCSVPEGSRLPWLYGYYLFKTRTGSIQDCTFEDWIFIQSDFGVEVIDEYECGVLVNNIKRTDREAGNRDWSKYSSTLQEQEEALNQLRQAFDNW